MNYIRALWREHFIAKLLFLLTFWVLVMLTLFQFRYYYRSHSSEPSIREHTRHLLLRESFQMDSTSESSDLQSEPRIDKSPRQTEQMQMEEIQKQAPNLPIMFWNKNKNKKFRFNSTCAPFPNLLELEYNNLYWQTLRTESGTFELYGAYYDIRAENTRGPTIRILGMINRVEPIKTETYCQIWFDDETDKPLIVKTVEYKFIWYKSWGNNKNGIFQPYLISCPFDARKQNPVAVSLVEKPCDTATNSLRVIFDFVGASEKKEFAVCVKGLDFLHEDLSVKLVEWIELLGLLGADKVFFYELEIHPNISKVLRYYEQTGLVHVTPLTIAGGQPNVQSFRHYFLTKKIVHKRQNELIPYNDCFYKHMYQYKYITLLDVDEIIMPVQYQNWSEMMTSFQSNTKNKSAYYVRNVYFLDDLIHSHGWIEDIPKYMHMLQHVYRAKSFTKPGAYVKSFLDTERCLTLHNHLPFSCLSKCSSYQVTVADAQLQHYRADCVTDLKKTCDSFKSDTVMDTTIWRYKNELIARVTRTLTTLGFFG